MRLALISQFQNPQNVDEENQFTQFTQKQLQIHDGTKNNLNRFHYRYQQNTRFFYNQRFFSQVSLSVG